MGNHNIIIRIARSTTVLQFFGCQHNDGFASFVHTRVLTAIIYLYIRETVLNLTCTSVPLRDHIRIKGRVQEKGMIKILFIKTMLRIRIILENMEVKVPLFFNPNLPSVSLPRLHKILYNRYSPLHSTSPSPTYPGLHLHKKCDGKLQHSAFCTHLAAMDGSSHSLISKTST